MIRIGVVGAGKIVNYMLMGIKGTDNITEGNILIWLKIMIRKRWRKNLNTVSLSWIYLQKQEWKLSTDSTTYIIKAFGICRKVALKKFCTYNM